MSYETVGRHAAEFGAPEARRLTLTETLALWGIRAIPQDRVDAHIARLTEGSSKPFQAIELFLRYLSLAPVFMAIGRALKAETDRLICATCLCAAALMLIGIALAFETWGWLVLCAPALSIAIGAWLFDGAAADRKLARWEYGPAAGDGGHEISNQLQPPEAVRALARKASLIPGVRLQVGYYADDPILYAVSGWGPWCKRVPVGAWATGDSYLDHFVDYQ